MRNAPKRLLAATAACAIAAVGIGAFLIARSGTAQVQLVTVPGRDTVELTIYRSEDLTFAKEQRNITLREGSNLIQFSWAGTRIDPTSAQLKSVSDPEHVQALEAIYPKNLDNAILCRVESATAIGGRSAPPVTAWQVNRRWDVYVHTYGWSCIGQRQEHNAFNHLAWHACRLGCLKADERTMARLAQLTTLQTDGVQIVFQPLCPSEFCAHVRKFKAVYSPIRQAMRKEGVAWTLPESFPDDIQEFQRQYPE